MKHKTLICLLYSAMFAALLAVCSWITVPGVVPFALQTFAVFAVLTVLGGKYGTLSIALYLALGAVGVPVFSGFRGGVGALFGTTGGYLFGFLFAGLFFWLITRIFGKGLLVNVLALVGALFLVYAIGTLWFLSKYTGDGGLWYVLGACVFPFILPDAIKMALAVLVGRRVAKLMERI